MRARTGCQARLFLALTALAFAAGCGHTVSRGVTLAALDALPREAALRGFVHHDDLLLVFSDGPDRTIFLADWKENVLESSGQFRFRMANLKLVDKLPASVEKLRPSVREATVIPDETVSEFLKRISERLAPAEAGQAVLLALPAGEYMAFRDQNGAPRVARSADAPAGLQEVGRFNATQFAAEIFAAVEKYALSQGLESRLFLLQKATDGRPSAFFLLDLDQKVLVLALAPNQADAASEQMSMNGGMRKLEAALVEGQVLAAVKNPVSFVARAVNFGVQTVKVLLRWRLWPRPDPPPVVSEGPGMDLPAFEASLDSKMGSRRYKGAIRLLINGETFFPLLERRIDEAKESLHFRVCIWDTDDVGVALADRLRRRSADLKEVDVVVDRVTTLDASLIPPGSAMPAGFTPPRAIQPYLRDGSSVKVRNFLNAMFMGDHSKVYIVDRRYAYLGGMNVGREYRYEWHDVMVELEGPVVGWFERDFQLAWSHAGGLGDLAYAAAYVTQGKDFVGPQTREDYVDIRPIYTKTGNPAILRSLVEALSRAKRYAWIENPYIYDDTVIRALIAARSRGVDVRVVMPTQADMNSADSNNKVKANRLLSYGVRVYAHPGMAHTKVAVVDGWAILGSCNFNKLSLRTNIETGIATSDPGFVAILNRELFEADFARSRELTEPLPVTGSDRLAELLAHQT